MQTQTLNKIDVRGDEKSPSLGKTFSQVLRLHGESLASGVAEAVNWLKQQKQFVEDLKREIFHRCLIEALHYPQLFKKARWQ
ncbi:MAG: hypothetical protein QXJ07_05340 [Candidatus Bathyarchaeia archaeon]